MVLDGIMFEHVIFYPLAATFGCVRAKPSVRRRILDDILMHAVVKGDVFYFIGLGRTKNGIVLCESRQYWF